MDDCIVLEGYLVFRVDGIACIVEMNGFDWQVVVEGRVLVEFPGGHARREVHNFGYFLLVAEIDLNCSLSSLFRAL